MRCVSMLNVMIKPASSLCNMNCTYCFYKDESSKREVESYGMMSEITLEAILQQLFKRATRGINIAFQGGEPTLRGLDFYQLLIELEKKYNIRHLPIHHAFQTNGLLLNEDWCNFFHEHHFLVGISIDGIAPTHNLYRKTNDGKDTYHKIVEKTKLLDHYHVDYNILTVVNKDVATHITEIYQNYQNNGWKYQQYIPCLDELEGQNGMREYSLTPELYGKFLVELFQLWNKDARNRKQPYIRLFENYVGMLLGYAPEACDMYGRCGISYVIEANGDCYPCDFYMVDKYRLGNFTKDSIERMDQRRKEIGFVERSSQISDQCKSCKYIRICRGGCQRHRELDANQKYLNYFCDSYLYFYQNCLEDLFQTIQFLQK